MADLAERVDDLICSFDSAGDTTMDTLSMLIFGWMLFGLVVLCVGKYVYNRFVLNELGTSRTAKDGHVFHGDSVVVTSAAAAGAGATGAKFLGHQERSTKLSASSVGVASGSSSKTSTSTGPIGVSGAVLAAANTAASFGGGGSGASSTIAAAPVASSPSPSSPGYVPPTPPVRKRLTRKTSGALITPARSSRALHLPTATGADAEAVRWVNELIVWLHSDLVILNELLALWVASLNDFTAGSVDERTFKNIFSTDR